MNGSVVQRVGDWWLGSTSLVVLPPGQYDLGQPLAEIPVDASAIQAAAATLFIATKGR